MARQSLADKVIAITGASSGIGRATAVTAAAQGAGVILLARSESALKEVLEDCRSKGAGALAVTIDVRDAAAMTEVTTAALSQFGRIDAWVNNAAVSSFGEFEDIPLETFHEVIETNLFGYVNGARAVLPVFRRQGHGVLIQVASGVAKTGQPFTAPYTVSKYAIRGLSSALREELVPEKDIHVCTVYPGSIDTPIFQHAANYSGRAIHPLRPIFDPSDVAKTIVRLVRHPKRDTYVRPIVRLGAMLRAIAPKTADKTAYRSTLKGHFQGRAGQLTDGNVFRASSDWHSVSGDWRIGKERRKAFAPLAAVGALALTGGGYWAPRRLSLK